jgi:anaerobic magnesium-protoporphyrin IX monomethyl ester cyclase
VQKTVDEIEYLVKQYNREFFHFIDGTWDENPEWNNDFAEEILRRGLKISWWCYNRADNMLRDEKLGILEKLVKAGLRHPLLGAERMNAEENRELNKRVSPSSVKEVFDLMDRKYPQLVKHVTFLAGLRHDTPESLNRLYKYARTFKADIVSLLFATPMPGTEFYNEAKAKGWIKVHDFSKYHWFEPIMETETMTLEDLKREWYRKCLWVNFSNFWWKIKRMFSPHPWINSVNKYGRQMAINYLKVILSAPFSKMKPFRGMAEPSWYND